MVLKLFSQVLRNTRYTVTIFNNSFSNERDYECLNLWCQILFPFRHKTTCYLTALNNIRAQLKSILTDLRARNFVQVKTSLRARCMQARQALMITSQILQTFQSEDFDVVLLRKKSNRSTSNPILCST